MTGPGELEALAILGGRPRFAEPLHVGRPNIGDRARLHARLDDILDRRRLSNDGPYVREFEARVAAAAGTAHCVAVANATVGLGIAARALGLAAEVIVPAFTFVATVHALHWLGLTPVFCDILPDSHQIDPASVAGCITPRTSAILGVHLWGQTCDVEALDRVAGGCGVDLFFDAAHAFRCTRAGAPVGGFGRLEVFSFHATKFVNAFEGGAITTNDAELAHRLRLMRNFGFETYDTVASAGTNGKMSEISAAMGLTSLEAAGEFLAVNRSHFDRYGRLLRGVTGLRLLAPPASEHSNLQYVVLEVDEAAAGLTRDELVRALWAENVLARRYFHPGCHRMEPYATLYPDASARLPVTERVASRVMTLPTGTGVTPGDVEGVCALVRRILSSASAVRAALRR